MCAMCMMKIIVVGVALIGMVRAVRVKLMEWFVK